MRWGEQGAVATLLRGKLADREWTQSDLAAVLDRSLANVNELCTGKKGVSVAMALDLAAAFDMEPMDWLRADTADGLARAKPVDRSGVHERRARVEQRRGKRLYPLIA